MDHTQPQTDSKNFAGAKRTITLTTRTCKICLTVGFLFTLTILAGTWQGIVAFKNNKDFSRQIEQLTTEQYPPALASEMIDLHAQIDILQSQLAVVRKVANKQREELKKSNGGHITNNSLTPKKHDQLQFATIGSDGEEEQIPGSAPHQLWTDGNIADDFTYSGGLFIASPKQQQEEKQRHPDDTFATITNMPLGKPVPTAISSPFGTRIDPLNNKKAFHEGIDFRGKMGDPVKATGPGVVKKSLYNKGYGHYIVLCHNNGYETLYAHLSQRLVKRGERVQTGQHIGLIGKSGRSTGPHLHYEVLHQGTPVDPMKYIRIYQLVKPAKRPGPTRMAASRNSSGVPILRR
jgi:murein DD-endopeptidase MepM/ murein hydrolase activator NlpD